MNAIIQPADVQLGRTLPVAPGDGDPAVHTLRRTGRKAVRFSGWHLIEAIGANEENAVWHELNIYRTTTDEVVVELIVRRNTAEHRDLFRVNTFADLAGAAAWLEGYAPADDVPIPAGLGAVDTALPWAVLQSVQLRQRIEQIEIDYRTLLSEIFVALDLTDPAEVQPPMSALPPVCAPVD